MIIATAPAAAVAVAMISAGVNMVGTSSASYPGSYDSALTYDSGIAYDSTAMAGTATMIAFEES